ncbi:hypothetical protein CAEBREN_10002 [Caenorhabditis brenneri]|uniref:Uncharacterized protein n=1 Tax=Caenorhabditis brenneri TaxID=135651 RepID=G0N7G1_CAEBE|nr:hypothetical protein CAEBREN_10002 [Caenorhabditis brenneri]
MFTGLSQKSLICLGPLKKNNEKMKGGDFNAGEFDENDEPVKMGFDEVLLIPSLILCYKLDLTIVSLIF